MRRSPLFAASFALVVTNVAAQSIVFQDGFESGFAPWTATGLWQAVPDTDACVTAVIPFPEGVGAARYGNSVPCSYETGTQPNSGTLLLNPWIQLPSGVGSVTLYFQSRVLTEYCHHGYDRHYVQVLAQNGPDSGFTTALCMSPPGGTIGYFYPSGWHERRVDLTAYQGAQIRIGFVFDTFDAMVNYTLGWLVDDVRIVSEPGITYCPSAGPWSMCPCPYYYGFGGGCAQTNGASATLLSDGQASLAADSLTFTASHMPLGTTAVLCQAAVPSAVSTPFGGGLLCLGGNLLRIGITMVPTGTQSWPLAGAPPLSVTGSIPATGGNRYYQVFFRDNGGFCSAGTFNLTSAQSVVWTP